MILKYKVPKQYKKMFSNEKVIYCYVLKEEKLITNNKKVYLVRQLNSRRKTNVFAEDELKELNIIDKIKIKFLGVKNGK